MTHVYRRPWTDYRRPPRPWVPSKAGGTVYTQELAGTLPLAGALAKQAQQAVMQPLRVHEYSGVFLSALRITV